MYPSCFAAKAAGSPVGGLGQGLSLRRAAENIIASQTFRATAHDCTNNPGELMSADATIIGEITIV
jgi:hypothetical protein